MTLTRQLWLAVITVALLAFTGSFFVSTVTARNYLENQLSIKNSDNATSLALSMSQSPKDMVTIDLQVSAMYDSGQYALIRLYDPDDQVMIEKINRRNTNPVPDWFKRLFPIEPEPGQAQVSDGWNQFARIELISQTNSAYQELWQGTLQLLFWFTLGSLLVGTTGSLMLRRITRPLATVVKQAHAITQRQFIKKPEPSTPELRSLARAMNEMVDRLQAMFAEEAARLETVRQEANHDALTGLANRSWFMSQLEQTLQSDESAQEGTLFLLRLTNLLNINRRLGREVADQFLKQLGAILARVTANKPGSIAARLNGADFALLLPGITETEALAEDLLQEIQNLAIVGWGEQDPVAYLAHGHYQHGEQVSQLLSRIDHALATAEAQRSFIICRAELMSKTHITTAEDWRHILTQAIEHRHLRLVEFPVLALDGTLIHQESPLRLRIGGEGEWLAAGNFMPPATRLNLTADLDLAAVSLGIERLLHGDSQPIAINLSGESVRDPAFRRSLHQLLLEQPHSRLERLWLEIAEPGVFQHFDAFIHLCHQLKPLGCHLGIEHFGQQFSRIGDLHQLGLDYLKVDSSFMRNIHEHSGNQTFLQGLCQIAHTIGLVVIAEGIQQPDELAILSELGFDGATGPAVRTPEAPHQGKGPAATTPRS